MSKMLWELELPPEIALAKEDIGKNNIWKYMRYFNMFMSRYRLKAKTEGEEKDISYDYFSKILFAGKVGIINDVAYGVCVGRLNVTKEDASGNILEADFEFNNGKVRKNLKVGKDLVVAYSDMTRLPPILYIIAIGNKIITKEAIIDQQDNMLRKPIVITGEGEDFDNAVNNAENVLSGIEWINTKRKAGKNKKGTLLDTSEMQVLNLQLGNAYKGAELWDSRKHYEEFLCEYMGYTTTKNEKRERMNTMEVENDNSIGDTFRKSAEYCIKQMIEDAKKTLKVDITLEKILTEEVSDNGSSEKDLERTNDRE